MTICSTCHNEPCPECGGSGFIYELVRLGNGRFVRYADGECECQGLPCTECGRHRVAPGSTIPVAQDTFL